MAAPALFSDDDESQLDLKTDASKQDISAVHCLVNERGERPITSISQGTTTAEESYSSNELECLTLVWALTKLCHHLYRWWQSFVRP